MKNYFLEAKQKITKKDYNYLRANKNWELLVTVAKIKTVAKYNKLLKIKNKLTKQELKALIFEFQKTAANRVQKQDHIQKRLQARSKNKLITRLKQELKKQQEQEQELGIKHTRSTSTRLKMKLAAFHRSNKNSSK